MYEGWSFKGHEKCVFTLRVLFSRDIVGMAGVGSRVPPYIADYDDMLMFGSSSAAVSADRTEAR